ncbi:alpha-ketoglutarate dehydrogenase [Corticibacter populi]|uniref:Pyruvate dehydrogenase E1 component n=1 Tax=Corticibacter populi TaxID=1550736 RepID=A0A3M6QUD4_9BURK|nr:alpha-ketoglutarate dehydrogenase [Corticibacter populi]RMX06644.1 alpha-ketoglutarate dehydrogenase [Corticibacter populi]RZS31784.1 pyruvate dehydrogenase E1 component [Corticibacter populi]
MDTPQRFGAYLDERQHRAPDPAELQEWRDALDGLLEAWGAGAGAQQACAVLDTLLAHARRRGIDWHADAVTPYLNTVPLAQQREYPGDTDIEKRLSAILRWNALAMVVRANAQYGELGGHIASYASAADLFETGFQHFFKGPEAEPGADLVYFQPHSAPGVYARAFLEGRLSEDSIAHYRQELSAQQRGVQGLSSYPHPWLMPDFWQFPTGSMGIGPINAIYQARFMRYLEHRGLLQTAGRRVWGFFGDGEMDEPESIAALTLAAREGLDNCTFVINCNLQRLDGPVRGNGRIVDELESLFAGAGWNVIKCLWGSEWDALLARDHTHTIARTFAQTVDGEFQTLSANDGAFNRSHFFSKTPELQALVAHLSDAEIDQLRRGGHDPVKIHAAFLRATQTQGRPSVVLAKTMKGYGMGSIGQGRMTTHQQKKLGREDLLAFRDRFRLPISDAQVERAEFYKPAADSPEMQYLHARRRQLGGCLPQRRASAPPVAVPTLAQSGGFAIDADGKAMSTTMAFVRQLGNLLKDAQLGPRIVPIVADEARTFGMANLFRQVGIYAPFGQLYLPEDAGSILAYREIKDGQILEEGISEAGAISSWTAAATSYSTHGLAMLPFYIYYSMFGFQRIGDLIWAAADQRARGFLIGATSGRTTLGGEGLQHQDGTSHLAASTIENCRAYDPAFAGELAVIIDHGARRMMEAQEDAFYYITVTNENVENPSLPDDVHEDVLRGMYRFRTGRQDAAQQVQLLGSGAIMGEVLKAAAILEAEHGIGATVWSVTSYTELAREGQRCERAWRHGERDAVGSWFEQRLADTNGPIIAATDYVRALPDMVRAYIPSGRPYLTLGTDGFGRSDSRAALRRHFEVDAAAIVQAALRTLAQARSRQREQEGDALSAWASLATD